MEVKMQTRIVTVILSVLMVGALISPSALSSSHREAPGILGMPQVDGTDFYMFRSYESGRSGFVTFIANYNPLQDAYGGPNYFPLDPNAAYDIHIDNSGDAVEDVTFRFRFNQTSPFLTVPVGGQNIAVPLANIGSFGPGSEQGALNVTRTYSIDLIRGDVDNPTTTDSVIISGTNEDTFGMPFDNIGGKSIQDYETYARSFIRNVSFPGCVDDGKVLWVNAKNLLQSTWGRYLI
jgi:hypothetical protein